VKKLSALLILFLLLSVAAKAELFEYKNLLLETKKNRARDKASGKQLWSSTIKVARLTDKGKDFVYITEDGSGIYGGENKNWSSRAYYYYNGTTARPYQAKLVYKSPEGKILQVIEKSYDPEGKKALFRVNNKDTALNTSNDLIDKELLGLALANYPFDEKREFSFHLLTNEPKIYPMTIKYIGEEPVAINGKEIAAHKIQMIPDLGALNIFGAFVPKTYFWFTKEKPHDFLRYEGLESGMGTPYIVIETVQ